ARPMAPAVAPTLYGPPTVPFAVNVWAVATPEALVVATQVRPPQVPPNVPLGPEAGAWNVTFTFGTPTLLASLTVACGLIAKAVLIAALCGVPAVAMIEAATWPTLTVSDPVAALASEL